MKISVKLIEHNDEIIANCPELDINCYGANKNEAIRRIKRVINFYINSAKELGLEVEHLDKISIEGEREFQLKKDGFTETNNTIN